MLYGNSGNTVATPNTKTSLEAHMVLLQQHLEAEIRMERKRKRKTKRKPKRNNGNAIAAYNTTSTTVHT
jgi:hypothetical protein